MRQIAVKQKKKLYELFFILFLTLSVVLVVVGGSGYLYLLNCYKEDVAKFNTANIQRIDQFLDFYYSDGENLASEIIHASNLGFLTEKESMKSPEELLVVEKVIDSIQEGVETNPIVSDAYIYFNKSEKVISNNGMYEADYFYETYVPEEENSYEQWKEALCTRKQESYTLVDHTYENYDQSVITYYKPFNIYSDDVYGCVVLQYNIEAISEVIQQGEMMDVANFQLCYSDTNEVLIFLGDAEINRFVLEQNMNSGQNRIFSGPKGKLSVTYHISPNFKWKSYVAIPLDAYYHGIYIVRNVLIFIIVLQIFLGSILAVLFSRKSYGPIEVFVSRVRGLAKEFESAGSKLGQSELEEVAELTERMVIDRSNIKKELDLTRPTVINSMLIQLLTGSRSEKMSTMNYSSELQKLFPDPCFFCCIFRIEECKELIVDGTLEEMNLVRFIVTNVLEELLEESFRVVCITLEANDIALVCNRPQIEEKKELQEYYSLFEEKIQNALTIFREKFKIYISVGISQTYNGMDSLYLCNREAKVVLNSSIVSGLYDVNYYNQNIDTEKNYHYSLEDEICLINCLKTGDYNKTKAFLNQVIRENHRMLSEANQTLTQWFLMELINTLARVCNEMNLPDRVVDLNLPVFFKTMNLQQSFQKLYEEYEKVCLWISKNKKSHNEKMKKDIVAYIHEHYLDNSMSLIEVADHIGINSSYLSTFIKENMGDTFLNYVTKLRMDKAKGLLLTTDLSLQEIAEYIGYANSGAFIRVFKKKFELTPGAYRNQYKE